MRDNIQISKKITNKGILQEAFIAHLSQQNVDYFPEQKNSKRILIAGTGSGCGKTTVTTALLSALKARGIALSAFKCGPDYIDPMFHRQVLEVPCRNLDPYFCNGAVLRTQLSAAKNSLSIIEGVMGYYDGIGTEGWASTWEVARKTGTPVILVVNPKGMYTSVGAILKGFREFQKESYIQGVIFNGISPMLYDGLKSIAEAQNLMPLGFLTFDETLSIGSRHLGLVTAGEIHGLQEKLNQLGQMAEKYIDLDGILTLAETAKKSFSSSHFISTPEADSEPLQETCSKIFRKADSEPLQEAHSKIFRGANSKSLQEAGSNALSEADSEPLQEAHSKIFREADSKTLQEAGSNALSKADSEPLQEARSNALSRTNSKTDSTDFFEAIPEANLKTGSESRHKTYPKATPNSQHISPLGTDSKRISKLDFRNRSKTGYGNDIQIPLKSYQKKSKTIPIAVARDQAFCFLYQENLELLESLGCRLLFFSPLEDEAIPKQAAGLYLPGGYPELYVRKLSQNQTMLQSIRQEIKAGLPTIAECGGFLYLHELLDDFKLVGIIPGKAYKTEKLQRFGYIELTAKQDNLLCKKGESIRAHEFHYWDSANPGEDFIAEKPSRSKRYSCIHATDKLYAGFPHLYFPANPTFAENFVKKIIEYERKK